MRGSGGEHGQPADLPAQDRSPKAGGVGGEHVVGSGVHDEPSAGVDLAVELTFGPTGVPGEDAQVLNVDGELARLTERKKFGSESVGVATRRRPRTDSLTPR
jgi:hypothetical protein